MKAYETELTFREERGHAIVVEFDKPWRLVFFSKFQNVAYWDLGGVWMTPEWLETHSTEDGFCYEPIMDKDVKYSRVDIIESNPVRRKIKWHYALCNPEYEVFNGNTTADEYYTVYPDGIAIRKLVGWPGNENEFGGNSFFWEVMELILQSEEPLEKVVEKEECLTLMNEKGEKLSFSWPAQRSFTAIIEPLCNSYPQIKDWNFFIGRIRLKNRPDPFCMFVKDKMIFPYEPCSTSAYGSCNGDHPPIILWDFGRIPNSHSTSFISIQAIHHANKKPHRPSTWLFLTGATEVENDRELIDLCQSWYSPAEIIGPRSVVWGYGKEPVYYEGYSRAERTYNFRKMEGKEVSFLMRPGSASRAENKSPVKPPYKVINPVFKISGWKTESVNIFLDDKMLDQENYKFHVGEDELIVWINKTISNDTRIRIEEIE